MLRFCFRSAIYSQLVFQNLTESIFCSDFLISPSSLVYSLLPPLQNKKRYIQVINFPPEESL